MPLSLFRYFISLYFIFVSILPTSKNMQPILFISSRIFSSHYLKSYRCPSLQHIFSQSSRPPMFLYFLWFWYSHHDSFERNCFRTTSRRTPPYFLWVLQYRSAHIIPVVLILIVTESCTTCTNVSLIILNDVLKLLCLLIK